MPNACNFEKLIFLVIRTKSGALKALKKEKKGKEGENRIPIVTIITKYFYEF